MYTAPKTLGSEASLLADAASQPAISLGVPPSKSKGIANAKQDKEKNPISITLMPQASQEGSTIHPLLTLYPTSKTSSIEWRDALRFLVGQASGEETEEFTELLTNVGLRVKLLDILAGGVEIPTAKPMIEGVSLTPDTPGKVAITGEFWYDSMVD